jgi:DNA-binding NarL/FixJ family response regulator
MWAALRMHLVGGPDAYWSRRPDRPLTVTERQQRIIALVREGRTNPQIATEIGFSVPTIKSELAKLCVLLGATSRSDLAAKAARAGF